MSEQPKFKFSQGSVCVEYEGELEDLKNHLADILNIMKEQVAFAMPVTVMTAATQSTVTSATAPSTSTTKFEATTNTIASKLNCKSGPDLVKAASVQLTLVQGKQRFTRQEIITEMKTSSRYKKSYLSNLSNHLDTLTKNGFLNETSKDTYTVDPNQLPEIEASVA